MEPQSFDALEQQLGSVRRIGAAAPLREQVLAGIHRELASAQWDRRLGRATIGLLLLGLAMNATLVLSDQGAPGGRGDRFAGDGRQQQLVETAVLVAETTDAQTGRQYARHLASQSGLRLTSEQVAAIDEAIEQRVTRLSVVPNSVDSSR